MYDPNNTFGYSFLITIISVSVQRGMANNHASQGNEVNLEGIKYVTELDETKTRVVERFRIGKELGHVLFY